MKITFLGTGTSQGIPVINCHCQVCLSKDKKNVRLRSSVSVQSNGTVLLIDTTPDLRQQLLKNPLPRLDAIIYTHAHADHIYGIDDVRRYNQLQDERIPVYASDETLRRLQYIFDYAFNDGGLRPGIPNFSPHRIDGLFRIKELVIEPIPLIHGYQEILGFRIGNFAYCTDVSQIPKTSYSLLEDLDVLVLDALREKEHPTHLSVNQAIDEAAKIKAKRTYFIHMSHKIDHTTRQKTLPATMAFAYDGLILNI